MIEFLKKHALAIGALVLSVVAYFYFRGSSSSAAATAPYGVPYTPQYYVQGTGGAGGASPASSGVVTAPSATASGAPASAVTPYMSPTSVTPPATPMTQMMAVQNPFATQPNSGGGMIGAIQAALTGMVASTPSGGATFVDPALQAALNVSMTPGGLAAIPLANSYLNSPAYENLQKSQLAGPGCCTPDSNGIGGPNSPCCQISIATGELGTGSPTPASVEFTATSNCEQSQFNQKFFGYPADPNCNGSMPLPSEVAGVIPSGIAMPQPSNVGQPNWLTGKMLPANWNMLTQAQQMAYEQTGVIPPSINLQLAVTQATI